MLSFGQKCIRHPTLKRIFPLNTEDIPYRTTDPFEADFGEFWDTLYLAKVCLEHKISYEISPE